MEDDDETKPTVTPTVGDAVKKEEAEEETTEGGREEAVGRGEMVPQSSSSSAMTSLDGRIELIIG